MGMLVDGRWQDTWYDTKASGGSFKRENSQFRNWVTANGGPGSAGEGGFVAEPDRYHLYVSLACPWAHRVLIMRRLKRLETMIPISVVNWLMLENGWTFAPGPGVTGDPINGADYAWQVYTAADPHYTGRATVPILWDKARGTIVSNESAELIRMLNSAFDGVGAAPGDYYPEALRGGIDAVNDRIYATLNNGVYQSGFATTQEAYEAAVRPVFDTLDWLEQRLSSGRYLMGDVLTEADIRLFPTLIRFDSVYYSHFKCNVRRIVDYPNLWGFTRDLYQMDGIAGTVDFTHIKNHYYRSHPMINPTGIVPIGPQLDLTAPHGRG